MTVVKTFSFAADAEGLADAGSHANIAFAHEAADGSPANGCVKWTTATNSLSNAAEYARRSTPGQTWETWGVPAGAVVTAVQVTAYKEKVANEGGLDNFTLSARIVDSAGASVHSAGDLLATASVIPYTLGNWENGAAGSSRAVDAAKQASTTDVRLELEGRYTTPGAGAVTADVRFDTIEITITYTPAYPSIQAPSAMQSLADAENSTGAGVNVARSIATGDTVDLATAFNRNAANADLLAHYGGAGAYCIAFGLGISVPGSGLNLPVAAGQALIGGIVEVSDATSLAVANNATSYIWLRQNATLTYTADGSPPAGAACYLGSCVASGGNITSVSTKGVVYLRGGTLIRETDDSGPPADSPPSTIQLLNKNKGAYYWWDGSAWFPVWTPGGMNKDLIPAGEVWLIPANYQAYIFSRLIIEGRVIVEGKLRVEA